MPTKSTKLRANQSIWPEQRKRGVGGLQSTFLLSAITRLVALTFLESFQAEAEAARECVQADSRHQGPSFRRRERPRVSRPAAGCVSVPATNQSTSAAPWSLWYVQCTCTWTSSASRFHRLCIILASSMVESYCTCRCTVGCRLRRVEELG